MFINFYVLLNNVSKDDTVPGDMVWFEEVELDESVHY